MNPTKLAKLRKGPALESRRVIVGLELALASLREVKRIQTLKVGPREKISRIGTLVRTLREKGRESGLPLLAGLAEALEDALIAATDDGSLPARRDYPNRG